MSTNIEKILCHLEFLGYENARIDTSTNIKSAVIKAGKVHPYNIALREYCDGFISIEIYLIIEKSISPEMYIFINKLNNLCISKFNVYKDESTDKTMLKIQTFYIGDYIKTLFAQLIDAFQKESIEVIKLDTDGVFN